MHFQAHQKAQHYVSFTLSSISLLAPDHPMSSMSLISLHFWLPKSVNALARKSIQAIKMSKIHLICPKKQTGKSHNNVGAPRKKAVWTLRRPKWDWMWLGRQAAGTSGPCEAPACTKATWQNKITPANLSYQHVISTSSAYQQIGM